MGLAGLGAALMSLSQSVPKMATSFDEQEELKRKREKETAELAALAESMRGEKQRNDLAEQTAQETAQRKAEAQTAFHKYTTDIDSLKQMQATQAANSAHTEEHRTGLGLVPDYAAQAAGNQPGYPGPISEDYQKKLGDLAGKKPLEQMSEYNLQYHAAADPGIANVVSDAEKEQDRQEQIEAAKAKAEADRQFKEDEAQKQRDFIATQGQLNRDSNRAIAGMRSGSSNFVQNGETNKEDDKIASDLAFGKLDPQSFNKFYSKFKGNDERMRRVYIKAQEFNPDFNWADYNADFSSYKNNAQRTQMSNLTRAESLLDTYQGLSDAVNRSDVTMFNKLSNKIGLNLSDINKTNLQTLQTVMTEDLSRALTQSGATSDKKMELAGNIADVMDLSNKAAIEKIKIIHEIIDANKKAIRDNWGVYGKDRGEVDKPKTTNFNSVQEAEAANLQKGTVIYINGRKAVVE